MTTRRRLVTILPALLAIQGCANLQGGPTESADLPNMIKAAMADEGRNIVLLQRAEWGAGRGHVIPLYNPFNPIASDHPAKVGVVAATDHGVYFLSWERASSEYIISRSWPYVGLESAELRRFGAGRTVVLRGKGGTVDAVWLMKNRYVQDTAGTEAFQDMLARRMSVAGAADPSPHRSAAAMVPVPQSSGPAR